MKPDAKLRKASGAVAWRERVGGRFALIELMMTLMIMGLLVSIAVPTIFGMRRKAQESDAKATVKDSITAVAQLYDDNQRTWEKEHPETGEETTKLDIDRAGWWITEASVEPMGPVFDGLLPAFVGNPAQGIGFTTELPVDYVGTNNTHMVLMWTDDPVMGLLSDDDYDDANDPFSFTLQGIPMGPPFVMAWTEASGFTPYGGFHDFDSLGRIIPEPSTRMLACLLASATAAALRRRSATRIRSGFDDSRR